MNAKSRIIYLWIDNYRILHNAEFYFTKDYNVHLLKKDEESLEVTINKNNVKDIDILDIIYEDTPLSDCSIIIGENGTGKTSIASVLYDILCGDTSIKYCLVIETGKGSGIFQFYSNLEIINQATHKLTPPSPLNIVYYSPCYSSTHTMTYLEPFIDISTTTLINKDAYRFENKIPDFSEIQCNLLQGHRLKDIRRICTFLSFMNSESSGKLEALKKEINIPRFLHVYPQDSKEASKDKVNWKLIPRETPNNPNYISKEDRLDILLKVVNTHKDNEKCRFLDEMAVGLYNNYIYTYNHIDEIDYRMIEKNPEISLFEYIHDLISNMQFPPINNIPQEPDNIKHLLFMKYMNDIPESFFKYHERTMQVYIEWELKYNLKEITDFINKYQDCSYMDFLHIEFDPFLSSGEYNFMILFARLYEQKEKIETGFSLIFLDEVESTLHYRLQIKSVNLILIFFNTVFQNAREGIQLIFSSHSPLLLSDFTAGHIIKLKTIENQVENGFKFACDKQVEVINNRENLFGANMYQLCSDGFLINESLIGDFSRETLEKLIDPSSNFPPETQEYLINSFADPVIQVLIRNTIEFAAIKNKEN